MKKTYKYLLVIISLVGLMIFSYQPVKGNVNSAVGYLKTKDSNPWITMALVSAGESVDVNYLKSTDGTKATDYEAPILALTAAGKDPKTFPDKDLIAELKSFHVNGQIGDESTLNDDIFGILALVSAGESASDQIIQDAKNFILQNQNTDGGWSFAVGGSSDTNMTAMGIMALLNAGISSNDSSITNAVQYLKDSQNTDGGFPYDPQSQWGTDSDASSDAWVISALNKLGENLGDWEKNGASPIDHLLSLQTGLGYFEYQEGTGEDSFSSVTTSYAVIALSGKYYPVDGGSSGTINSISYKIEGSTGVICEGETNASNPLNLIESEASICGFTYHITETSFGPYLDKINEDEAEGTTGWLYAVNFTLPSIGAVDYELQDGDYVIWHYGSFDWQPSGTEINLSANLLASPEGMSPESDEISFSVNTGSGGSDLSFGDVAPGGSKSGVVTITNNGQVALYIESVVTGDTVFKDYININGNSWMDFSTALQAGDSKDNNVSLDIPFSYSNPGIKTGKLIFWGTPN